MTNQEEYRPSEERIQERNNAAVAGLVEMYGFGKPKKETCKNSRKNKNDKETQNAKDKE